MQIGIGIQMGGGSQSAGEAVPQNVFRDEAGNPYRDEAENYYTQDS